MLEQQERSLDRQKWYAGVYWVYAVVLAAVFLVLGAERAGAPVWFWTTAMGLVLLIGGAVEMVKYVVNRARLELLREIKALELQVREMRETGGG